MGIIEVIFSRIWRAKVRDGWNMGRFGSRPVTGYEGQDHFLWHFRTALLSGRILLALRQNFSNQNRYVQKKFPAQPVLTKKNIFTAAKTLTKNPTQPPLIYPLSHEIAALP
jgi:hypothetical protein